MNDLREVMKRGPFDIIVADPPWPEPQRDGKKMVHARKPEELQDWIEEAFTGQNRLELFARRNRPGWTCYGNEV